MDILEKIDNFLHEASNQVYGDGLTFTERLDAHIRYYKVRAKELGKKDKKGYCILQVLTGETTPKVVFGPDDLSKQEKKDPTLSKIISTPKGKAGPMDDTLVFNVTIGNKKVNNVTCKVPSHWFWA